MDDTTLAALQRLRASHRKLVFVTGRELPDLLHVFPRIELFDRIVGEAVPALRASVPRPILLLAEWDDLELRPRAVKLMVKDAAIDGAQDLLSASVQRGGEVSLPAYGALVLRATDAR